LATRYVVRRHADAAARQQACADLLDQQRVIVGEAVLGPIAHGVDAEGLARAFPPGREREHALVDLAVDEGVGVVLPVGRLDNIPLRAGMQAKAGLPVRRRARRRRLALARMFGGLLAGVAGANAPAQDVRIDEEPAALARHQEALFHQVLIGQDHRVAGDLQRLRQRSAGGQGAARRDLAVENGGDQHAAELGLQGRALLGLEVEQKRAGCVAHVILPIWPRCFNPRPRLCVRSGL